jgi:hypothetical protein
MALLAGFAAGEIMAGTVTNYTSGDVLLCFRNGQTKNLVVDLGQYSSLTNGAVPNQRIPITQFSGSQISYAFGDVNGLNWSAFGWQSDNTLLVTRKRTVLNKQSLTPSSANNALQAAAIQNMSAVPTGGNYQFFNGPDTANSTSISVVEPQSAANYPAQTGKSYYNALYAGAFANFGGTLPSGDPEVATPDGFDVTNTVVRSDLYQIPTGSGTAGVTYLGYFEFAPNGSMTFVVEPSAVPVIKSISRSGNNSIISYTAGLYGTYTLRGTNVLSGAVTNWPAITTVTSGDTAIHSVTDTTTDNFRFYTITAQ